MRETTNPYGGLTIGISLWYTIMGDFVLNSSEGLRDVLRRSEQLRGISVGVTSENLREQCCGTPRENICGLNPPSNS